MKFYSPKTILILFSILCFNHLFAQNKMAAVKVVVAGTSHGHVALDFKSSKRQCN